MKKCEWLDEKPSFFKEVIVDGERIATIKALTVLDEAEIQRKCGNKVEYAKDGSTYVIIYDKETELEKIYKSLTGHPNAGWVFDKEVTRYNIAMLPPEYYNAIKGAVIELEMQNRVTEKIKKN